METNSDKTSGKVKQGIGKLTGDEGLQNEGKAQETKGNVAAKIQSAGRKVADKIDSALDKKESK